MNEEDKAEFEKLFPKAAAWIIERVLQREYESLKRKKLLNSWERKRLDELEDWKHNSEVNNG
jgi:hypothetical protein